MVEILSLVFVCVFCSELKLLLLRYVNVAVQEQGEVRFPRDKEADPTPSTSEALPSSHSYGIEMVIR
jgi:hypothetical protein